jgi:predicted SprT family Zn-dependent metalloprotease
MHTTDDPTKSTYAAVQAAWRHFNKSLFSNQLPPCLVTLQRRSRAHGYFSSKQFEHLKDAAATTDEIALNPKSIRERPPEATLSTLVHEMVHLWQDHFGHPGRGRYHNKAWADAMEQIGLMPSHTGKPGGKRTGDTVSHYIIPGGPFAVACGAFLAKHQGLQWGDRPVKSGTGGKRAKYICADCGLAAWAKPGVQLFCGEHDNPVAMPEQRAVVAESGVCIPIAA